MSLPLLTQEEVARCCPRDDEDAGFGALRTPQGNLPLKLLDVQARVVGLLAETELRQTYVNTLGVPLEATYIFPLPDRAAVSAFRLTVGERVVEGQLKERGQARRDYQQAIQAGHRAAITEEERPGVFTMRVGNLMPGEEASVFLVLNGPVPFSDGEGTFRFPLVVAPRYIPGSPLPGEQVGTGVALDTDAVPDASRISPPVLLPGFPNPVRLSVAVELDPAGLSLGAVRSSLHAVTEGAANGRRRVTLRPGERLDRDFVLRFGLGAEQLTSSYSVQPDGDGEGEGTFQLLLVPPRDQARVATPRDVVFVLDRSGSMRGWKMVAARRATARMLDTLTPDDRFAVLAFDHSVERPPRLPGRGLVAATDRNRFRAVGFLAELEARGGTEMAGPLQEALRLLEGGAGRARTVVLVTDGQVGNEDQILRTLGPRLGDVRVFSLGIDRAVNAGFLRRLAGLSGGYCELVESEDRLDATMDAVHRRIGSPLLTELELELDGGELLADSLVPARLPDMFQGAPLRILGRYRGAPGALRVRARDEVGCAWSEQLSPAVSACPAAPRVWARGRIRALEDRYVIGEKELSGRIVALSLRFGVLCRFTSFVAVDRAEVVNRGGTVHQVTQAVEQPSGWGREDKTQRFPGHVPYPVAGDPFAVPAAMPRMAPSRAALPPGAPPPVMSASPAPAGDPFGPPTPSQCFEAVAGDPCGGLGGGDPFAAPAGGGANFLDAFSPPPPAPPVQRPPRASAPRSRARKARPAPRRPREREEAQRRPQPVAAPLDAYRRRGRDLLGVLAGSADGLRGLRQRTLARLALLLGTLIDDLRSVGGEAAQLRPLEALRDALRAAQQGGRLEEAELERLERRTREVLEAFVNAQATAAPPGDPERREGFWM